MYLCSHIPGRIYTPSVTDTNEQPTQDGGGGGDGGDDGKYTSDQVVAITLPVITVVVVVMVTTMVGAWLLLQWRRKRYVSWYRAGKTSQKL